MPIISRLSHKQRPFSSLAKAEILHPFLSFLKYALRFISPALTGRGDQIPLYLNQHLNFHNNWRLFFLNYEICPTSFGSNLEHHIQWTTYHY